MTKSGACRYMLDTHHADAVAVGKSDSLVQRLRFLPLEAWCISAITLAELQYGLEKGTARSLVNRAVETFLQIAPVVAWDTSAGKSYGQLRAANERAGRQMHVFDEMIAAHALSSGLTVLTGDKALARVPGLSVENWLVA